MLMTLIIIQLEQTLLFVFNSNFNLILKARQTVLNKQFNGYTIKTELILKDHRCFIHRSLLDSVRLFQNRPQKCMFISISLRVLKVFSKLSKISLFGTFQWRGWKLPPLMP